MKEPKPKTPAPVYAALYSNLAEAAQKCGYALAIHGSLQRDMDLVAIPWTEYATSEEVLMQHLEQVCGGPNAQAYWLKDQRTEKLHGRVAHTVLLELGTYLDVSVMPRTIKNQ